MASKKRVRKQFEERNFTKLYFYILIFFSLFISGFFYFIFDIYLDQTSTSNRTIHISKRIRKSIEAKNLLQKSNQVKSIAATIPQSSGKSVSVPIFYYHYIGNNPNPADKARDSLSVTPDKFDSQMNYLSSNGFNPISLDTLYAAVKGGLLPPKPIVLSFDDGYVDFYLNAFPILKKYNLHAVVFIPTGLMDSGYYLKWSQIKEMDASGFISFEAHIF